MKRIILCALFVFILSGWLSPSSEAAPGLAAAPPRQEGPRPVVMVHGFSSSWEAWASYLGPEGYLAKAGMRGFAVGDGQAPGVMNTGRLDQPTGRTNTIAENAAILGEYIAGVKELSGATQVDLLAHSMGGLIARYYIDRLMPQGEVAQLIMLGSPMAGTDCAMLPTALGYYLPAVLEIRPSYVRQIFNPQIEERHGVRFHALAGNPIVKTLQSPCAPVPSDIVVSFNSVTAIPLEAVTLPILHHELNTSERIFREFVLPRLQTPLEAFEAPAATGPGATGAGPDTQFSQIFSGHLAPGESQELVIPIEAGITVARFAMYDSSRSLTTEVRGASGNVITLDVEANGLVTVEDPQALFYLGYGFENPRPGEWRVTVQTTPETPAEGADFALTALFEGGARLIASASPLLPALGDAVEIQAALEAVPEALPAGALQVEAYILGPGGERETLPLSDEDGSYRGEWRARRPGLHAIEVFVSAHLADGSQLRRTTEMSVEVQPELGRSWVLLGFGGLILFAGLVAAALGGMWLVWKIVRRR